MGKGPFNTHEIKEQIISRGRDDSEIVLQRQKIFQKIKNLPLIIPLNM